jgi:hypothetical protein
VANNKTAVAKDGSVVRICGTTGSCALPKLVRRKELPSQPSWGVRAAVLLHVDCRYGNF